MAFIIDKSALDSLTTNLCCLYPPKKLDGETIRSVGVYFEGDRLEFYINGTRCSDVSCERTPIPDPPCVSALTQPLKRTIVTSKNKNVYINKKLFAIQGDLAQGLSSPRKIVGPFKYTSIRVANTPNP